MPIIRCLTSLLRGLILLAGLVVPALAQEPADDPDALGLFRDGQPAAPLFRSPRPTSKIAENVTVITSDDIARLNAHTLAEALQTVPGFQLDQVQTPGSGAFFSLLSATSRHVLVKLDGIPQNFLSADLIASLNSIPVQMVERVEIVKGAASAAWGPALGGAINIITKSPDPERSAGGIASASTGERSTSDLRGELTGTLGRLGYYLTGGNLYSRGLTPGTRADLSHGFGKFTYDLPQQGRLTFALDLRTNRYGLEDYAPYDYHDSGETYHVDTFLSLAQPLSDRLSLESRLYLGTRELQTTWGELSGTDLFMDSVVKERVRGADLHLFWGERGENLIAGLEVEHTAIRQRDPINPGTIGNFSLDLERWAGYLNGTYTVGPLAILPGLRFDHYSIFSDALSYTLGATLRLSDTTLLRAYAARGYGLPLVNNLAITNGVRDLQQIWTVQTGIETTAMPHLWLKGTLFYNDTWKIQQWDTNTTPATATLQEQIKQGFELEVKTTPLRGFALGGSYNYTDARDRSTGKELSGDMGAPRQGAKLSLDYRNDTLGLTGTLTGNYVWWHLSGSNPVSYTAPIWDLHLTQKLAPARELSPELFFSVHNLFNGSQYQSVVHPNAPRWIDGGVRFRF